MKTLENLNTTELSEREMNETSGGFGLLVIAFLIGFAIAQYEKN